MKKRTFSKFKKNSDINCILCGSSQLISLEKLRSNSIKTFYLRKFNIPVDNLFKKVNSLNLIQCKECQLHFFIPQIIGDDNYYQSLEKMDWYYEKDKYEYRYSAKFIEPRTKVLDVGCGEGKFSNYIKKSKFTGLEFNSNAVKIGKSRGLDIRPELLEAHSIKHEKYYDVLTIFQVLEHVTNPGQVIKDAVRCLKTKGLLIIAVPSEDSFMGKMQDNIFNIPPHHQTRWKDFTLEFIPKENNLRLLKLHHEPLSKVHSRIYFKTMILSTLFNLFKLKISKFNDSIVYRLLAIFAVALSYPLDVFLFDLIKNKSRGHSVIAIYQK